MCCVLLCLLRGSPLLAHLLPSLPRRLRRPGLVRRLPLPRTALLRRRLRASSPKGGHRHRRQDRLFTSRASGRRRPRSSSRPSKRLRGSRGLLTYSNRTADQTARSVAFFFSVWFKFFCFWLLAARRGATTAGGNTWKVYRHTHIGMISMYTCIRREAFAPMLQPLRRKSCRSRKVYCCRQEKRVVLGAGLMPRHDTSEFRKKEE